MKKIFTLMAGLVIAASASATPYKALYVQAIAEPSGAGVVYLGPKSDEDQGYVYDISEEEGETAFIQWVGGENSDGADMTIGCTKQIGLYEVLAYAFPENGYEFVCFADKVKEDGIYNSDDCYSVIHGNNASEGWTFDFEWTGNGDKINVNSLDHEQDGHSSDGISRDEVYERFAEFVHETPDTYVYAIFRKVGDELPKFVPNDENSVKAVNAETTSNGILFNAAGQQVGKAVKGIVIQDGKKMIVK